MQWRNVPRQFASAARWSGESSEDLRAKGSGFAFDPDYAAFLQAVRTATPEDSTVSVVAPRSHGYYTIQAVFTLAPRRVVRSGESAGAGFTAFYKDESALALPGSRRIRNGVLIRR